MAPTLPVLILFHQVTMSHFRPTVNQSLTLDVTNFLPLFPNCSGHTGSRRDFKASLWTEIGSISVFYPRRDSRRRQRRFGHDTQEIAAPLARAHDLPKNAGKENCQLSRVLWAGLPQGTLLLPAPPADGPCLCSRQAQAMIAGKPWTE